MKILSAAQTRKVDAYTIEHEPVASIDLMERAAQAFVDWFTQRFPNTFHLKVFCGLGNNGGDGLAIARLLHQMHYQIAVYIVRYADKASADFVLNEERLKRVLSPITVANDTDIPAIHASDIVIDAIFGSGLSRPTEGLVAQVIGVINTSQPEVIAVDMPSGLFVDAPNPDENIIQATHTVSFQLPKLSFLLPQNEKYVGDWHVVPIGLSSEAIAQAETPYYYIQEAYIRQIVRKRPKFSHKGLFGHALLIAGSHGKMGAAVLAAKACLRSGVGLLTLHVPWCGYEIMQISVPEAMCLSDTNGQHFSEAGDTARFTTVGIGPGLGTEDTTAIGFEKLLQHTTHPMVLDADALNLLAKNPNLLTLLPPESILTPHPKEFERLVGQTENDYERLTRLQEFAEKYKVVVVLKGAHSAIGLPSGEVYFNVAGNPGMATGGTGDVLTGIITALVAQQYPPAHAAIIGVYIHAMAGDQAALQKGYAGLIASDLADFLPEAFRSFEK